MARKNRTRRRKTRLKKITRIYSRKAFLGYRKSYSSATVKKKRPAFRHAKRRIARSDSRALLSSRSRARSGPTFKKRYALTPLRLKKRTICESRRVRREVMFAINKNGKSGQKKPVRRNPDVTCRRK